MIFAALIRADQLFGLIAEVDAAFFNGGIDFFPEVPPSTDADRDKLEDDDEGVDVEGCGAEDGTFFFRDDDDDVDADGGDGLIVKFAVASASPLNTGGSSSEGFSE